MDMMHLAEQIAILLGENRTLSVDRRKEDLNWTVNRQTDKGKNLKKQGV